MRVVGGSLDETSAFRKDPAAQARLLLRRGACVMGRQHRLWSLLSATAAVVMAGCGASGETWRTVGDERQTSVSATDNGLHWDPATVGPDCGLEVYYSNGNISQVVPLGRLDLARLVPDPTEVDSYTVHDCQGLRLTDGANAYADAVEASRRACSDEALPLAVTWQGLPGEALADCVAGLLATDVQRAASFLELPVASGATDFVTIEVVEIPENLPVMLAGAGFSGSALTQIGMTRALDGIQRLEADGYALAWNYHPDVGLALTIERRP